MPIKLSSAALDRVQRFLASNPAALGMRFGVERTGCSGWGYVVDLAHEQRDGDQVIEQDDVRIYIDADSFPLVAGTRIDFSRQGLNEQFTFENPKSAGACGCGESFTTDAERMA